MARMDHSRCDHPATTSARTKCRKAGGPAPIDYVGEHLHATIEANKIKNRMDAETTARLRYAEGDRIAAAMKAPKLPPGIVEGELVEEIHCSECGRTPEGDDDQGYSGCCNEPLVADCRPYADGGNCHHIVN